MTCKYGNSVNNVLESRNLAYLVAERKDQYSGAGFVETYWKDICNVGDFFL